MRKELGRRDLNSQPRRPERLALPLRHYPRKVRTAGIAPDEVRYLEFPPTLLLQHRMLMCTIHHAPEITGQVVVVRKVSSKTNHQPWLGVRQEKNPHPELPVPRLLLLGCEALEIALSLWMGCPA